MALRKKAYFYHIFLLDKLFIQTAFKNGFVNTKKYGLS